MSIVLILTDHSLLESLEPLEDISDILNPITENVISVNIIPCILQLSILEITSYLWYICLWRINLQVLYLQDTDRFTRASLVRVINFYDLTTAFRDQILQLPSRIVKPLESYCIQMCWVLLPLRFCCLPIFSATVLKSSRVNTAYLKLAFQRFWMVP